MEASGHFFRFQAVALTGASRCERRPNGQKRAALFDGNELCAHCVSRLGLRSNFLGEKNDFLGEADDFLPKAETGVGRGLRFKAGELRFVTGKQQLEAGKNCFLTVFFLNDTEQATMSFFSFEKGNII